jgi:hypothetical protein
MSRKLTSNPIEIEASYEAINNLFVERKWSDGLPVVPPTPEAVEKMLAGTGRNPEEVIGIIPPCSGEATVEKIAINSVMAGCLPEYLPVVIATVEGVCETQFNLSGIQVTTHPVPILLIVNGPITRKLDINCKSGAFGPGWRTNATIGRAVRLILINLGGAFPGTTSMVTQGQPGRYTFCVAENEEQNPWSPLHVDRGFAASDSTVTVCGAENPHNINEHAARTGEELLSTIAGSVANMGSNNVISQRGEPILALGPEHAATLAKSGFTKQSIRDFLHEKARIPKKSFYETARNLYFNKFDEDTLIPITARAEDIMIIVLGGPGKHSCFLPTFGDTRSVTRLIK